MRGLALLSLCFSSMGCSILLYGTSGHGGGGGGYSGGGGGGGYNQNIVGEYDPWGKVGRPQYGTYPDPLKLLSSITDVGSWSQACSDLGFLPVDSYSPKAGQSYIASSQVVEVYLDRDATAEKAIIVQTYSGEIFVATFALAYDEASWVYLGTHRLPTLARDAKCRSKSDGIFRAQGANVVKNAPQFLWIEVQSSDLCSEYTYTERSLHLFALIDAYYSPILEFSVTRESRSKAGFYGEQLSYAVKVDEKQGGILFSGPREVYGDGGSPQLYNEEI